MNFRPTGSKSTQTSTHCARTRGSRSSSTARSDSAKPLGHSPYSPEEILDGGVHGGVHSTRPTQAYADLPIVRRVSMIWWRRRVGLVSVRAGWPFPIPKLDVAGSIPVARSIYSQELGSDGALRFPRAASILGSIGCWFRSFHHQVAPHQCTMLMSRQRPAL